MKDSCSSISHFLERYFDRQATDEESALVERHLPDCPVCRERLRLLEGLRDAIKSPVDEALKEETFPWVWEKIEKGIRPERRSSWWESVRSWLDLSPLLRRKVWIPVVATSIVLLFMTAQIIFKKTPSYSEASVVEYVESDTCNVMVYELEKQEITVIWVFEEPDEEVETS
jgi:predicted anti-sigma-YlaC factor YlaD